MNEETRDTKIKLVLSLKNMKGFDFKHNINLSLYRMQSTMCACGRRVCSVCTCTHAYMEARGHWVATSITIQFIPLRQSLSLNSKLCWQPASPSDAPVSAFCSAGVMDRHLCTAFYMGARSSNSGPCALVTSPLTHRVIFPTLSALM